MYTWLHLSFLPWTGKTGSGSSSHKVLHEWLDNLSGQNRANNRNVPSPKTITAATIIKQKHLTRATTLSLKVWLTYVFIQTFCFDSERDTKCSGVGKGGRVGMVVYKTTPNTEVNFNEKKKSPRWTFIGNGPLLDWAFNISLSVSALLDAFNSSFKTGKMLKYGLCFISCRFFCQDLYIMWRRSVFKLQTADKTLKDFPGL